AEATGTGLVQGHALRHAPAAASGRRRPPAVEGLVVTPTPGADCAVSHARLPIFVSLGVDDAVGQYSGRSGCRVSVRAAARSPLAEPGLLPRTWLGPCTSGLGSWQPIHRSSIALPASAWAQLSRSPGNPCPAPPRHYRLGHCLGVTGRRTSPGRNCDRRFAPRSSRARPPKSSRPALAEQC